MSAPRKPQRQRRKQYSRLRFSLLFGAFLVILVNPFLNFYFQINIVQGWFQSLGMGALWFVSPLEGLESLLITKTFYMPSLIGMLIPVAIALFLGRVFCSWVCPVTFFLEIFDRARKFLSGRKYLQNRLLVAKNVLWYTLIAEIIISMVIGAPLFVFLSPPGLIGREIMMVVFFKSLALEGALLLLILMLELLTRRFFCRSFCPLGGLLAFLGRKRSLQLQNRPDNCTTCGLCSRTCPMGLAPNLGEGQSPYCWNCGECIDCCEHDALRFTWKNHSEN